MHSRKTQHTQNIFAYLFVCVCECKCNNNKACNVQQMSTFDFCTLFSGQRPLSLLCGAKFEPTDPLHYLYVRV